MDIIWGTPINVVDGDTFDISVTHYCDTNAYNYNDVERIRIKGIDAPELPCRSGQLAKRDLKRTIMSREIELHIHTIGAVCGIGIAYGDITVIHSCGHSVTVDCHGVCVFFTRRTPAGRFNDQVWLVRRDTVF